MTQPENQQQNIAHRQEGAAKHRCRKQYAGYRSLYRLVALHGDDNGPGQRQEENPQRIIGQRADIVRRKQQKGDRRQRSPHGRQTAQAPIKKNRCQRLGCHIQIPERQDNAIGAALQPFHQAHQGRCEQGKKLRQIPFLGYRRIPLPKPLGRGQVKAFVIVTKPIPAFGHQQQYRQRRQHGKGKIGTVFFPNQSVHGLPPIGSAATLRLPLL